MKVYLRALGCRLNQGEMDALGRQFEALGHTLTDDPTDAEHIIVNTCAVTHDAAAEGRRLVRQLHRAASRAEIAVTGCYAQLAPDDLRPLPGVTRVVNNLDKEQLVTTITGEQVPVFDLEPLNRDAGAGWAGRTRTFVKVQDGCDNACTFCVTTIARGAGRSRPLADVVAEVGRLYALGYREAVLTGVHLGSYGSDLGLDDGLFALVRALLADTDLPRIRLSSLEPWDLAPAFFALWDDPRIGRHLHLPLQSGCDATLRRMARRTTQAQFRQLVAAARDRIPALCITSDVIVGFPGETDDEFAVSEAFVCEMQFAGLHVFRYSRRPGTAAARMRGHVDETVKRARSARLHALAAAGERAYAAHSVGAVQPVLWEHVSGASQDGFVNVGYTDHYLRVRAVVPRPLTNLITPVRLDAYDAEAGVFACTPLFDQH